MTASKALIINGNLESSNSPVEGWYLETLDGLFFAVKGSEHPPDRWIGVLRYAPDENNGDRRKNGMGYRRLYHFTEQEQWILKHNPQYLAYDSVFQATLQSVPISSIRQVYNPVLRVRERMRTAAGHAVEDDALDFLNLLQLQAEVPRSCLGVTGSLLIGLHTKDSDLDMVVFGKRSCRKVYKALHRMMDSDSVPEVARLDARGIEELYAQRVADTSMRYDDFVRLEKRKVNQGRYRKRPYFIRFVEAPFEAESRYGQRRYAALGRATIAASIADDRYGIFTPCRYLLSDVRGLEGPVPDDLNEMVSFRGRFCEQACIGEAVVASGVLERVREGRKVHHRLLLGNFPEDTFVVKAH